jgi:uncharacterized protein YjbI with pentapeptide repeats
MRKDKKYPHFSVAREHLSTLSNGQVPAWNAWRDTRPDRRYDLRRIVLTSTNLAHSNLSLADCSGASFLAANLDDANFTRANLTKANLTAARLRRANFYEANLLGAELPAAKLTEANFEMAMLTHANLGGAECDSANFQHAKLLAANLTGAKLCGADLRNANLTRCNLVEADLSDADLTGCRVYGLSAWRLKLDGAKQQDLIITKKGEPDITVDNIEVAQFVDLLLHNEKIRDVVNTIGKKTVLILGRFTPERKAVLDSLRHALRKRNYLPILFDFDTPASRDITETVSLLAHMARFVIADITDARSLPQELAMIVPDLPSVPVQPLLLEGSTEFGMFEHFTRYPWVLETYRYFSPQDLIKNLTVRVLGPAEAKVLELRPVVKKA